MQAAVLGRVVGPLEEYFGKVWSACEVGLALSRLEELGRDPYREALVDDIERRGFHVPLPARIDLEVDRRGRVTGVNPYVRVAPHGEERVVAHLSSMPGARTLVLVCHCYGVPIPGVMGGLFGLQGKDRPIDVAYNIMPHHQPGTFPLWPGSGFARVRVSRFIENLRSAVTGARALLRGLQTLRGYDRVVVVGFSIGGQVALHVATSETLDGLVLYCPVVSLRNTAMDLGLMKSVALPLRASLLRLGRSDVFDDLSMTEPLRYPLRLPAHRTHVIVQRYDALAPTKQIEIIRDKYPSIHWYEYGGTHLFPAGLTQIRRIVQDAIETV